MLVYTEDLACKKDHVSHSALKPEISIGNLGLPLLTLIQDVQKIKIKIKNLVDFFPLLFRKISVSPQTAYSFTHSLSNGS